MTNEKNRNAYIGRNVEILFKNSIGDNPKIVKLIQNEFNIDSHYVTSITSGIHGEKADVKMSFASGHNIDVNIKAYKKESAFNQLTRTTVSKFCEVFDLDDLRKDELEKMMVHKSRNTKENLFPESIQGQWFNILKKKAIAILKWGFSYKQSREILVLYERNKSIMQIYSMKTVLSKLKSEITFTKGGFNIGECVSFQRKGGNSSLSRDIPKDSIKHPGNNIQLKLKINKFIEIMEDYLIGQYSI